MTYAAGLGVPRRFADRLWATIPVINGTHKFDLLWVGDGVGYPPLRGRDYREIAVAGAGLHVWPTAEFDLAGIGEYLEAGGVGLWLDGSAAQYRTWAVIEKAPALRMFRVRGKPTEPVDIARIASLITLDANGWSWRSGLAAPNLEALIFESASTQALPIVQGRLKYLIANMGRALERIEVFGDLSELEHCSLIGGRRLDLRGLEVATRLKYLFFKTFLALDNADVLLELPALESLYLEAIREVHPVMPLLGLGVKHLSVLTNHAFGPDFTTAVPEDKTWRIQRYRLASEASERGLITAADLGILPEVEGQWSVRFDNWEAAEARFKLRDDEIDSTLVESVFAELLGDGWRTRIEFDSEGDFVEARFQSRADSVDAVKIWIGGWNDDAVLRKVLRKVQHRRQE